VRPEKIRLLPPGEPHPGNALAGKVVDASFIGVSTHYLVHYAGDREMAVMVQNLEDHRFAPGEQVQAVWMPEHTFVVE
jgi:spermidine/putrescine transport system ATP-binding protein